MVGTGTTQEDTEHLVSGQIEVGRFREFVTLKVPNINILYLDRDEAADLIADLTEELKECAHGKV